MFYNIERYFRQQFVRCQLHKLFSQFGVEELHWPGHRPDVNPPSNTCGMNWNTDCEPGRHPNITEALVTERERIPTARFNI